MLKLFFSKKSCGEPPLAGCFAAYYCTVITNACPQCFAKGAMLFFLAHRIHSDAPVSFFGVSNNGAAKCFPQSGEAKDDFFDQTFFLQKKFVG
ncbi:MAG: hypothetical protein J5851_07195, partial [Oscillospiraceae bacterium]|nr:hypothetical protein [Oscillospiraceae bacterium]